MKRLLPPFVTLLLLACGAPAPEMFVDEEPVGGAAGASAAKFDMWLSPSYFRGFDVGYWNENDGNKDVSDFQALKDTGANLAQIQSNEGTRDWAAPYGPNSLGIDAMDELVRFCNEVGSGSILIRGHYCFTAKFFHPINDALVVCRHSHIVDTLCLNRSLVNPLYHGFFCNKNQRFSFKTCGLISCRYNNNNFHSDSTFL